MRNPKRPVFTLCSIIAFLCCSSSLALAQRIGLAAPLSDAFAPLGQQLVDGAKLAAGERNLELVIADDQCSAEGGKAAAERFVQEGVTLVAGFLCAEALEAALPVLATKKIVVVTSGVSDFTLTEKRAPGAYPVFRLATGIDKEATATANILGSLWRSEPFAIIDDGTLEGRERAGRVLAGLKEQQLQPVFTDTFRPGLENQNALASRLKRAGATHVFVGGERDDVAAIGASAAMLKIPLTIAGGSQLDAASGLVQLQPNTLMIAPLRPETLPSAKPAIDALRNAGLNVSSFAITGFATAQIAAAALKAENEPVPNVLEALRGQSFETALGAIRFEANGLRTDNPNRLQRFSGHVFAPSKN